MTGLEPANDGVTTHCRNHLATPASKILNEKIKLIHKVCVNPVYLFIIKIDY